MGGRGPGQGLCIFEVLQQNEHLKGRLALWVEPRSWHWAVPEGNLVRFPAQPAHPWLGQVTPGSDGSFWDHHETALFSPFGLRKTFARV